MECHCEEMWKNDGECLVVARFGGVVTTTVCLLTENENWFFGCVEKDGACLNKKSVI
jgi:hypothetical protein